MSKKMTFSELMSTANGRELDAEETQYLNCLPMIEDDPNFWRRCGECAQKIKKHIEYYECAKCNHLCLQTLGRILWSLSCNDLELEANDPLLWRNNPDHDSCYHD